jgi:hypothetical protein
VDWLDVLAMALGVVIAGGLAVLVSPLAAQSDPDMVWEGRVAVGFAALLHVGPCGWVRRRRPLAPQLQQAVSGQVGSGGGWWWPRSWVLHPLPPRWPDE